MDILYKIGVVIGIIVIYGLATLGLAAVITYNTSSGYSDEDARVGFLAWLFGLAAFIVLAIFTLTKFGLWMG